MEKPKKRTRTVLVWVVLVLGFIVLYAVYSSERPKRFQDFDAFVSDVRADRVAEVHVDSNQIVVKPYVGAKYFTLGVVDEELTAELSRQGVPVIRGEEKDPWGNLFFYLLFAVVAVVVFWYLVRRTRGGMGDVLSMRKSQAGLGSLLPARAAGPGGRDCASHVRGNRPLSLAARGHGIPAPANGNAARRIRGRRTGFANHCQDNRLHTEASSPRRPLFTTTPRIG